jgi:hypothetical protein
MSGDVIELRGRRRLGGEYEVRIDLAKLSLTDLEHLRMGIDSAREARRRDDDSPRSWNIPKTAVEVIIVR